MINFHLTEFVWSLDFIDQMRATAALRLKEDADAVLNDEDAKINNISMHYIAKPLTAFGVFDDRLKTLGRLVSKQGPWREIDHELKALRSDIRGQAKREFFYHYPRDKALMIDNAADHWAEALSAFPSIDENIMAAIDCYALGHNNASIYHSMMILECGLPALAKKLSVTFDPDKVTWHDLIAKTKAKIDDEVAARAQRPKGTKPPTTKAEKATNKKRGQFLADCQEAAIQFGYFKDIWRNHIAHGRANYDKNDALKCLEHVRDFMEVLATKLKLKEKPPRGESAEET
jgi:hypothetical protein